MPTGEVDSCNSCLLPYNNKERTPKVWCQETKKEKVYKLYYIQILKCYHTYCKACLEQFMFQAGVITCLSCGKTTSAESVASLPENPYLRPEGESGGR